MPYPLAAIQAGVRSVQGSEGDLLSKNLPAGTATFRAAMAGGEDACLVYVIGDSIGIGWNASAPMSTNGWAYLLAAALRTKYSLGTGTIYAGNNAAWTEAGTWANSNNQGCWLSGHADINMRGRMSSTENSTTTLTATGSIFDLYYGSHYTLGRFKIAIDGGAEEDIDTISPGTVYTSLMRRFTLAPGEHTFVLRVPNGKYIWLDGMHVYSPGSLTIFNGSLVGAVMASHNVTQLPLSKMDLVPADVKKLFLVSLGTNDYGAQTDPAAYRSSAVTLINYLKTRGDVVLVAENWQKQQLAIPQIRYDRILQSLAGGNVGCVRMAVKWGTGDEGAAKGFVTEASRVHPNDAGHIDYKDVMLSYI